MMVMEKTGGFLEAYRAFFITLYQVTIKVRIMIIDFDKIGEVHMKDFKGGKGPLDTRSYADGNVKISYSTLRPGASTGRHVHQGNCEVVYAVSGEAVFHYDDQEEVLRVGQCHYCPEGHAHYMENRTDHDFVYFAIVPEHHL